VGAIQKCYITRHSEDKGKLKGLAISIDERWFLYTYIYIHKMEALSSLHNLIFNCHRHGSRQLMKGAMVPRRHEATITVDFRVSKIN
jgi:hypothetical protein